MATYRISKRIDEQPIVAGDLAHSGEDGAVLQFLGVVRQLEEGHPLSGIRYSCYEKMAWAILDTAIGEAQSAFGDHGLDFHHRLGLVAVAEPSVLIRVASGHSRDAFQLCQHYLQAVKTTLPIWKEPVYAS